MDVIPVRQEAVIRQISRTALAWTRQKNIGRDGNGAIRYVKNK